MESPNNETALRLPCKGRHVFGADCLSVWLTLNPNLDKTCPACRGSLTDDIYASVEVARRRAALGPGFDLASEQRCQELHRQGGCDCCHEDFMSGRVFAGKCRYAHLMPVTEWEIEIFDPMALVGDNYAEEI